MVFCGIDWAEDHHDVCLVDETGGVLWRRRIAHDPSG
ncbi:MAG: IS110 family transposase, partial [Candidatus Limnocylindria bacterium]